MFKEFGIAIRSLFVAITTLFGAANKLAKGVDHLCGWCEETAGGFADESKAERLLKAAEATKAIAAAEKVVTKAKASSKEEAVA